MTDDALAAWMALAYRSALASPEQLRRAHEGPRVDDFPADVVAREARDLEALHDLGVRVLTVADDEFPDRLRADGPIVLQVAGRAALLEEEGVAILAGARRLEDLERRAVVVLSKGMLQAKTLLRALHEPIRDGTIALVSAEPPRAAWGPVRDRRRDDLCRRLR